MPPADGWRIGDLAAWGRFLDVLGVRKRSQGGVEPTASPILTPTVEMVRYPVSEFVDTRETIVVTADGFVGIEVPTTEDWLVHAHYADRSTGTYAIDELNVKSEAGREIALDVLSSGVSRVGQVWGNPVPVPHAWQVGVRIGNHSVNGNLDLIILHTVFERVTQD